MPSPKLLMLEEEVLRVTKSLQAEWICVDVPESIMMDCKLEVLCAL